MIRLPHDDKNVRDLAQATINNPVAIAIAKLAAERIGVPPGAAFHELRFHLAYAYARGFVQGRKGAPPEPEMPITPDPLGKSYE